MFLYRQNISQQIVILRCEVERLRQEMHEEFGKVFEILNVAEDAVKFVFRIKIGGSIMATATEVTAVVGDTLDVEVLPISSRGNTVKAENVVFSVSDAAILADLTPDPDNPLHCTVMLASEGVANLSVDGDGHVGEGVVPIHSELPVTSQAEDAASFGFNVKVIPPA